MKNSNYSSYTKWTNSTPITYKNISFNRVVELNIKALQSLYIIQEVNPLECTDLIISQIIIARDDCIKLSILLDRLQHKLSNTDPYFRPLDLIITSCSKSTQVAENLTLIINSLNPLCNCLCDYLSIYEASLIDLQLSLNNLIIAIKLMEL